MLFRKKRLLQVMYLTLFFYFFTFTLPLWAEDKRISREIGIFLERFNWKEFAPNGKLIREESGLRKGVNMSTRWNRETSNFFVDFAVYGGTVDYNVSLGNRDIDINGISYFGVRGETGIGLFKEVTIGYIPVKTIPYLCLDFDYWLKKLKKYDLRYEDEDEEQLWMIVFWKIGLRGEIELTFGQLVADFWVGSDIFTMMLLNLPDYETAFLEPDGSLFYGTDLTLKYNKFFIRGYYKHYKWNKSLAEKIESLEEAPDITVYQPESEENDFGIVIGLTF